MKKTTETNGQESFTVPGTWLTMSQTAKLVGKMGRNKLFQFLRANKVLMMHNTPYQEYCDKGYFKLEHEPKYSRIGKLIAYFPALKVSEKGVAFISKLLESGELKQASE